VAIMMIRRARQVIWPVLIVWAVLLGLAFISNANWPNDNRLDFGIVLWIATFDLLLATVLLRRMHGFDLLAFTLGCVFLVKSGLWFTAAASQLWPEFAADHAQGIRWILRISLLISLPSAFAMLLITPDERYAREQRAEGVIEGHDAGMIEGHAEGMAQEASDQLSRENAKAD
jgi:hypothetical protein